MDTIIKIAIVDDDAILPEDIPQPRVLIAENATHRAYLSTDMADWSGVTTELIGQWDAYTGEPIGAISPDYAD